MGNAQRARPAQFDRSAQHRRGMIAKINIARQQLGMVEDDYRQLLFDSTGKTSLRACSEKQMDAMVEALKAKGFRPLPKAGSKGSAQHPMARKARALWISLYHLGVVHNPGEPALEAFAKRQLKCERLVWARQSDAFRLIEALKNMAVRNGWAQADHKGRQFGPLGLRESLCKAILQRLKDADAIPAEWSLDVAAWRLCGIVTACDAPFSAEQYAQLAAALGDHLRPALARKGGKAK
jgi:phage gp16-like protein